MFLYRLFGGVLRSEIEFPELEAAPGGPIRWTLRRARSAYSGSNGEHLGTDEVTGDVRVHMHRAADGLRLRFDDTGVFDIAGGGSTITWYAPSEVSIHDMRADFTSRVLAAALYSEGTLCLHGSAVDLNGVAIGLVAPKKHGKSTLGLALVRSGARLLTDDTLPVRAGAAPTAYPGLHATRLWADSAQRVGLGTAHPTQQGEKVLFSGLPAEAVSHESVPLAALYVLAPTRPTQEGPAARRMRLSSVEGSLVIVGNAKLALLLAKSEASALFRAAATLAQQLPVYRLHVVRDLDRLDEVVQTLRSWHAPTGALASESVAV
jgi:hypothetical protein